VAKTVPACVLRRGTEPRSPKRWARNTCKALDRGEPSQMDVGAMDDGGTGGVCGLRQRPVGSPARVGNCGRSY
jgi:hypothetical protein